MIINEDNSIMCNQVMKSFYYAFFTSVLLLFAVRMEAEMLYVHSQAEFDMAQTNADAGDSIVWLSGTYTDIFMDIDKDGLVIMAETPGAVKFTANSRVNISSDHIVFQGFQFLNGDIGTRDVINITGSHLLVTQINIREYTCYKYLRVRESSQYVDITHCNFENRLNLDDQNILSILVHETNPGYHRIRHCSFKNFDGTGNDQGIEPIRIGLSTQADRISRTVVEYCYFTQCNGDGELISSKATQNIYRHNTFENNPKAELVLRHGSQAIVYSNFFLRGKGGVRVREGQDHYIYNNYFYELDDRAIYLQNEASDPLANIHIVFNTIIDCSEIILGGDGSYQPVNVTFANNIFSDPDDQLFEEATGNETWVSNFAFGPLGIAQPSSGMTIIDPLLEENSLGYMGLGANSPAINSAQAGFDPLPQFANIDSIDMDILFDIMKQTRPSSIADKDAGCNEYPHSVAIQPIATEENSGPSYNTTATSTIDHSRQAIDELIQIYPNPVSNALQIEIQSDHHVLRLIIYDAHGKQMDSLLFDANGSLSPVFIHKVDHYPPGVYFIRAVNRTNEKRRAGIGAIKFLKAD